MSDKTKIGVCQMNIVEDKSANILTADSYIRQAAQAGCRIVVLPEMFVCPYVPTLFKRYAETFPEGKALEWMAKTAARERITIVGGSIPELAENDRIYNTSFIFDENGKMIAKHRKMHLADFYGVVPPLLESETVVSGDRVTVCNAGGTTLGIAICYDVRFPEVSREMALQGAKIIVFPAAFGMTTGAVHWELLMKSRAIDNQVFVVGAAPARTLGSTRQNWGHSLIVDPWGTVIAGLAEQEGLMLAEIDLAQIDAVRKALPLLKHRRPEIYNQFSKQ